MELTIKQVQKAANKAAFFVQDGLWYRMEYCDNEEGTFTCYNEDHNDEVTVSFKDVTDQDHFYKINRIHWREDAPKS